jgi:hypothetical protein
MWVLDRSCVVDIVKKTMAFVSTIGYTADLDLRLV